MILICWLLVTWNFKWNLMGVTIYGSLGGDENG